MKGKKQEETDKLEKEKAAAKKAGTAAPTTGKENEEDITAQFDAQDDEDVVF